MEDDDMSPEQICRTYPEQNREQRSRGPRKLTLKRSENGFGFTLRHFVVYPPEPSSIFSTERRHALRGAPVDRPMDTIFVKSVRPGSGAALAGLASGDQLVSVNGEPVAGRSYAQVVHLIQNSPGYLHLLVVPKEADLLQLYYGETAHNPQTNRRPIRTSKVSPHRSPASSPARRIDPNLYLGTMSGEIEECSSSNESVLGGGCEGYSLPPNLSNCRLCIDESGSRRNSHDNPYSSDDSIIMSRFRKSLEQKEEFLKGDSGKSGTSPLREFYWRPQKTTAPVWPPTIPASAVSQAIPKEAYAPVLTSLHHEVPEKQLSSSSKSKRHPSMSKGFVCGGLVTNVPMIANPPTHYPVRMSRVAEGNGGSDSFEPPPSRSSKSHREGERKSPSNPAESYQNHPRSHSASPSTVVQPLHYVSEKARQFESGLLHPDKTSFYKSELARLGTKRNVPNVAIRRREFETRAADGRSHRESRSLDSTTTGSTSPTPIGNLTIPIGSTKIHCDPPKGYYDANAADLTKRGARPRSNSVEGVWKDKKTVRSCSSDPPQRHKAVRQDSYLAAVGKPVRVSVVKGDDCLTNNEDGNVECVDERRNNCSSHSQITETPAIKRPQRPTRLDVPIINLPAPPQGGTSDSTPESDNHNKDWISPFSLVVKRVKALPSSDEVGSEDERIARRVSYIKATWADRGHADSDLELSDTEPILSADQSTLSVPEKVGDVAIEGQLYCKVTQTDGKKAHGRSWRPVWGMLRGSTLFLFKDKKDTTSDMPVDHERLDVTGSTVGAAQDYTKRRHVIRLTTPSSTEILLQANAEDDMQKWLSSLTTALNDPSPQQAVSVEVAEPNVSPMTAHKGLMKNITTTFRNRSPTGQSPVNKTRKASQTDVGLGASKSKTWKVRMAKQLKKIQTGSSSPVSPTAPTSYPESATIGVPLEHCPKSFANAHVPYLVDLCTRIVEERGLDIIGIYRVPGNTAAITSLTEAVNKGLKEALLDQDQRWSDVNVISSLLKLFFRKLPDCLLTTELYPTFIKADKIEDPYQRIYSIRNLVHELPEHNHETLKHLMMHLKQVVEHSDVNKMEARNLAIVFGPTLVRANDDNMVTMVTDMSHQCRIVETLIQHVDWCFGDEPLSNLRLQDSIDNTGQAQESESSLPNQSLLLSNVQKLEGMRGEVSRRDIVTSIISAANKKMKSKSRKQVLSAGEEVLSTERGDKCKDSRGGRRKDSGTNGNDTIDGKSSVAGAVAAGVRESVLFSESIIAPTISIYGSDNGERSKVEEPSKKVTANDGTIITYQGLSETTQARIKRFEMETKAMLQSQRDKLMNNKDWLKPSASPAIGNKIADTGQAGLNESSSYTKGKPYATSDSSQMREHLVDGSRMDRFGSNNSSPMLSGRMPTDSRLKDLTSEGYNAGSSLDSLSDNSVLSDASLQLKNVHRATQRNSSSSATDSNYTASASATTSTTSNTNSVASIENMANNNNSDLVSSLTLTFDAKMKSLGLTPPKEESTKDETENDAPSFRDPSLHRSFTSPDLEFKLLEFSGGKRTIGGLESKSGGKFEKCEVEKDDEKENCAHVGSGKLKRSESFKLREEKKETNNKLLRRSESLNKKDASCCSSKLKRSNSLTKTEKTDLNLSKRRQALEAATKKMKRKTGGGGERSIKRRHTVGGTKDFDKAAWLDNKEREASEERRTSSPDLSTTDLKPVLILQSPHSHLLPDSPLESHI